jgi:hypothetical protein
MTETPVLALPDFTHPFVIETDACATGIGAVTHAQTRNLHDERMKDSKKKGFLSVICMRFRGCS